MYASPVGRGNRGGIGGISDSVEIQKRLALADIRQRLKGHARPFGNRPTAVNQPTNFADVSILRPVWIVQIIGLDNPTSIEKTGSLFGEDIIAGFHFVNELEAGQRIVRRVRAVGAVNAKGFPESLLVGILLQMAALASHPKAMIPAAHTLLPETAALPETHGPVAHIGINRCPRRFRCYGSRQVIIRFDFRLLR